MSLTITIQTERRPDIDKTPSEQVAEALAAIGYFQQPRASVVFEARPDVRQAGPAADTIEEPAAPASDASSDTLATIQEKVDVKPVRERGKPSPGKKRRTAEEVAEDEAAATSDGAAASETPQISTGEERVGPEDAPELQAQDAADEAAEAEGGKIEDMNTLDTLRGLMGEYVKKHGMAPTQEDGPKILAAGLGPDLPQGAKNPDGSPATAWRLGLVPDEQSSIDKAVAAWREALAANPYKREVVGG